MTNATIQYYNEHAQAFVSDTLEANLSDIASRFTSRLNAGSVLLDWGCGSGRDSLAFSKAGFCVVPVDLSEEMAKATKELTGLEVRNEAFEQLNDVDAFDGIWACSSLLHAEKDQLPELFSRANRALRAQGCMYVSFKYGSFEGMRNGRYFTDLTETALANILDEEGSLRIDEYWISGDVRPGRENEQWLNAILVKR